MSRRLNDKIALIILLSFSLLAAGCGSSSSGGPGSIGSGGGDTVNTGGEPSDSTLQAGILKYQSDGDINSYYDTLAKLADPVQTPDLATNDLMLVRTGILYCRSKFSSASSNHLDLTSSDSLETIKSEITEVVADPPQDARALLAAAYLAQDAGLQTTSYVRGAISELEKLGTTNGVFNSSFTYTPQLGMGMTDADVHAMLGLAYYLNDNASSAQNQMDVALQRDPTVSSDFLKNLQDIFTVLGVSN